MYAGSLATLDYGLSMKSSLERHGFDAKLTITAVMKAVWSRAGFTSTSSPLHAGTAKSGVREKFNDLHEGAERDESD